MFCRSRCTHPGQWPETDSGTRDDNVTDQWSMVMPGVIAGLVTCGDISELVISGDIFGSDDIGGGIIMVDDIGCVIPLVGDSLDEESSPQAVSRAREAAPARTAPATVRGRSSWWSTCRAFRCVDAPIAPLIHRFATAEAKDWF